MTTTNGNGHVAVTTNGHTRPVVTVGVSAGDDGNRRPQKTAERVAADIVRDLVAEGLRTGDHLPLEAAMVERYHASRASVREALRLLEVQGLIHLKPGPGGGPVVGQVDPANLARLNALVDNRGVTPAIMHTFSFDDIEAAFDRLLAGGMAGKIAISLTGS